MIPDVAKALLEEPPTRVSIAELDRAVESCDDTIEAATTKLAVLQRHLEQESERIAALRDGRSMLAKYRDFVVHMRGLPPRTDEAESTGATTARAPSRRGAKPDAVLTLLADCEAREKVEIGKHLIGLGLMADTKPDWHSLDVLLSRLYRQGKLARPRPSVYQDPSAAQPDPLPTNDGGEE